MGSRSNHVVLLIAITLMIKLSECETRYFVKLPTNSSDPLRKFMGMDNSRSINGDAGGNGTGIDRADTNNPEKSRSSFRINDDETMIRESLKANLERRNSFIESSTFDPDVLNKFLDDYANKIKSTTEKNYNFPFRIGKPDLDKFADHQEVDSSVEENKDFGVNKTAENAVNSTLETTDLNQQQDLNDTIKRNKYFGANANDDRNGWVTLEAIPWSKSKISKWQASSSSQRPWPDAQVWEKPMSSAKPWNSEFPSRPAYINNEPWPEPPKVQQQRPDYQSSRPGAAPASRPQHSSTRPSYFDDRFDHNLNQAEKWPPERPQSSWDKFPSADSYRPSMEIITDDRPSNFPTSWDKYTHSSSNSNKNKINKYSYNDRDRFTNNYGDNLNNNNHYQNHHESADETSSHHDWRESLNNYPSKLDRYKDKPSNFGRPGMNNHEINRPQHSSHYEYTPEHPPSHPSNGEGQWVLLSTNHGYSKSRQRSLKLDNDQHQDSSIKTNAPARLNKEDDNDGTVAVMTSKRQVRLTVLPSINGTNTTTSHGGLLEVEKTFQTVDQSRKEYEDSKLTALKPIIVNNRPIRNTLFGRPSNSAVLAAVGAGILPATMAVMIPMMLGRKKRESPPRITAFHNHPNFLPNHEQFFIPPYHARQQKKSFPRSLRV